MFHQPCDLNDALRLRAELEPDALVINGGTDVVVAMNHRSIRPRAFLDISRVKELRTIDRANGVMLIGAGATFAQLSRLHLRALGEASRSVGGPSIRNMGTIGGNLVTASPAGDGSVALLALGAEIELTSAARGARWLPIDEFFVSYRKTALAEDELVTRIRTPADPLSRWYKIGKRGAVNISILCCAVARRPDGRFGIALGCAGPTPCRAPKAESLLAGEALTPELIEDVADMTAREAAPISDHRASADYRRAMCRTLARRLLADIANNVERNDADERN